MLLNTKATIVKQQWYYLANSWNPSGVPIFRKVISPKVNVIAQMEFELAYLEATVRHVVH